MELDEFRNALESLNVDIWTLIDTAIRVACVDNAQELKSRRDSIVERLYAPPPPPPPPPLVLNCQNCDHRDRRKHDIEKHQPHDQVVKKNEYGVEGSRELIDMNGDEEDDDEQRKILVIKKQLEGPDQTQESLVHLLQSLLKMDITFDALKETDIGRHVNRFRKHSSNEVRRLVKLLVRKWKETVDEWVRLNTPLEAGGSSSNCDGDSPHDHHTHHNNNIQCGSIDKVPLNGDAFRPSYLTPEDNLIDAENSASARKRLHENYQQDHENAKKQRITQVMDLHNVPKTRNSFVARNRGGVVQVKHW